MLFKSKSIMGNKKRR